MKHLSTVTSIVIAVVVLLAAFGIGLGIREIRTWRAEVESAEQIQPVSSTPKRGTRPSGEPSQEQRAELKERRAETLERMANLSEAEQEQFRSQMRDRMQRFDAGPRGGRGGGASPEERARMRERFENMTEEEREQFRAQMRERFGGRRRGEGGRRPGPPPGDEAGPPDEVEATEQPNDVSEE
ncbi:MAG: hypothetical protein JSU70_13235 [Phycisphaerales bacterium]|nr:MAG: hypothetical protein JSU70_13235 [Phycisphaerales bacterium]